LAEELYQDGKYAEAVEILEKFKRGSRSAQAEDLLKECKRLFTVFGHPFIMLVPTDWFVTSFVALCYLSTE